MRAFLVERMGYDAIFAQSVIVVLCGVAIELALVFAVGMFVQGSLALGIHSRELMILAAVGGFFLATASLAHGLAFWALGPLGPSPWITRVLVLLLSPLGPAAIGTALAYLLTDGAFRPDLLEVLPAALAFSYAPLGLPLVVAAVLAARKITKTRVNAEVVFGGTP